MVRPLSLAVAWVIPGTMALLLSGCAGVGNYLDTTINPFGNPNAPKGDALNMQRARGNDVAVTPIVAQPGDVWPGPVRPIPTLSDIQQHMNVPLGQEYENQYRTTPGSGANMFSVPQGVQPRAVPPHYRAGPATGAPSFGHPLNSSSTPPGSVQSPLPTVPVIPGTTPTPAAGVGVHKSFAVGQTLMGPTGPAGVVTGSSNGRYQTVAPINGAGGGILIPNGNGTATLIQPNGQVVTVQGE
ncbi:MAG: hypothetical protein PHT60_10425 [Acidiphilium sp.]|nr:hypothetical protein [Acidiphilium sp.]MDD4936175.1 hypothetical protein [Acidiphilium sp.]